jgi:uncharacterized membrane protein YqgA involved in biofilm formation
MSEPIVATTTYVFQHAVIAILGGLAHAINKHRTGESKTVADFLLLAIMSSFFGVLFGFLAIHFYPESEYLTMAVSGIGGWLGTESTGVLVAFLSKRFGVKP